MEEIKKDMEVTEKEDKFINLNNQIIRLEKMMDKEKEKIKKLDEMQEQITSLTKNLNICIGLLAKSIKGPTTKNIFDDMYNNNCSIYKSLTSDFDEQIIKYKKNINQITEEKEILFKDIKKELEKTTKESEQKEE